MLVLSRKVGERIWIGDNISVKSNKRTGVLWGFTAADWAGWRKCEFWVKACRQMNCGESKKLRSPSFQGLAKHPFSHSIFVVGR
jgi:hypothetical protein